MANWESLRLTDVIEKIQKAELVLPVIQRNLVWKENIIELLFDTLLRGDSFGGIMSIKDFRDKPPLFDYRNFILDFKTGIFPKSSSSEKLSQDISYIIDGQQRLQAFYIGLNGSYNNKKLYFNLFSTSVYDFRFSLDKDSLPLKVDDELGSSKQKTFWYNVQDLLNELKVCGGDEDELNDLLKDRYPILEEHKSIVTNNLKRFSKEIFTNKNIGICEVVKSRRRDRIEIKQEVVELFRRLNQGGTKLSALDLAASKLKAYDSSIEPFLNETINFNDLGFGQDELLKLIFILQDDGRKNMIAISQDDAKFISNNKIRIINSLKSLRKYLQYSKLEKYYKNRRPSIIPLYFITYYIFHSNQTTNKLENLFDGFETDNSDFNKIFNWQYLSVLNMIFRGRGAGWIAYTTGINKILSVLKNHKGKEFPEQQLYEMYYGHRLDFDTDIKDEYIDDYDRDFLFYSIYDMPKEFRDNDIDHIHPRVLLSGKYDWNDINSVANFQLLNSSKNRGEKSGKELNVWINDFVPNKKEYLNIHLIPNNPDLWKSMNFIEFIKINSSVIFQ